jgi:hypothetical protein
VPRSVRHTTTYRSRGCVEDVDRCARKWATRKCEAPSFKLPELALVTHGTDVSAFEVSVGVTPNSVHALRRFASISKCIRQ